jgi:hypothetical protein
MLSTLSELSLRNPILLLPPLKLDHQSEDHALLEMPSS